MKIYSVCLSLLLALAVTSVRADDQPWQNARIFQINREPMQAHMTPFVSEDAALKQLELPDVNRFEVNPSVERRITLDGTWKFLFSKNESACPKDFYKPNFNIKKWKDIQVPGSWETATSSALWMHAASRSTMLYSAPRTDVWSV